MKKTNCMNSELTVIESEAKVPTDLKIALMGSPLAEQAWANITPIARRDWISWIDLAKEKEMRKKRAEEACAMIASGKRCP